MKTLNDLSTRLHDSDHDTEAMVKRTFFLTADIKRLLVDLRASEEKFDHLTQENSKLKDDSAHLQ